MEPKEQPSWLPDDVLRIIIRYSCAYGHPQDALAWLRTSRATRRLVIELLGSRPVFNGKFEIAHYACDKHLPWWIHPHKRYVAPMCDEILCNYYHYGSKKKVGIKMVEMPDVMRVIMSYERSVAALPEYRQREPFRSVRYGDVYCDHSTIKVITCAEYIRRIPSARPRMRLSLSARKHYMGVRIATDLVKWMEHAYNYVGELSNFLLYPHWYAATAIVHINNRIADLKAEVDKMSSKQSRRQIIARSQFIVDCVLHWLNNRDVNWQLYALTRYAQMCREMEAAYDDYALKFPFAHLDADNL